MRSVPRLHHIAVVATSDLKQPHAAVAQQLGLTQDSDDLAAREQERPGPLASLASDMADLHASLQVEDPAAMGDHTPARRARTPALGLVSIGLVVSLGACAGASDRPDQEPAAPLTPSAEETSPVRPAEPEPRVEPERPAGDGASAPQLVETYRIDGEGALVGVVRSESGWQVAVRTVNSGSPTEDVVLHSHPAQEPPPTRAVPSRHFVDSVFAHEGHVYLSVNHLDEHETADVLSFAEEAPMLRVVPGRGTLGTAFRTATDGVIVRRDGEGSATVWIRGGAIARTEAVAQSTGQMIGASAAGLVAAWSTPAVGLGPFGPLHTSVVGADGDRWERTIPTPSDAGAGGDVVLAADGSVHVFLHGLNYDAAVQPTWWRLLREGPPTVARLESSGSGYATGQRIAACATGVALAQARRLGDELVLRAWMGAQPTADAPLELWRGAAGGAPRLAIGCAGDEALVALPVDDGIEVFRITSASGP